MNSCGRRSAISRPAGSWMAQAESIARRTSSGVISRSRPETATIACPLKPMMCEPARLMTTSSVSRPLILSASSTARLMASTAASGLTMTPLRRPRASASPMPTMSTRPPSPASPTIHVTLLVPISRPTVCDARLAIKLLSQISDHGFEICDFKCLTFRPPDSGDKHLSSDAGRNRHASSPSSDAARSGFALRSVGFLLLLIARFLTPLLVLFARVPLSLFSTTTAAAGRPLFSRFVGRGRFGGLLLGCRDGSRSCAAAARPCSGGVADDDLFRQDLKVVDEGAARRLSLLIECSQGTTEAVAHLLSAEANFDLRIITGQLRTHITQVIQVDLADALAQSGGLPLAQNLLILLHALAIHCARHARARLVESAYEKDRHLICRQHLTEHDRIRIDPDELSG